jgi:ATP-dependent DNA helicase DinG
MSWTTAEEQLAASLPGYESRPQQTRLALTIERAVADNRVLFAQAGTGTGKSFAALIPAIYHAQATGKPVVVATATKALQDQYATTDLPFLQEHLGVEFDFAVLKGRSNYLCRAKLADLDPRSILNGLGLFEEIDLDTTNGDFDALVTEIDPRDKPKMTTSSDECPGKGDCPFGDVCFAEAAKATARQADIVVVNHALLVTDLVVRANSDGLGGLLPSFGGVVVDEGHELEEYATNALGSEFTQRSLLQYATEVANLLGEPNSVLAVNAAAARLFEDLSRFLGREKTRALTDAALLEHEEPFVAAINSLRDIKTQVTNFQPQDDGAKGRRKRLMKRGNSLVNKMVAVVVSNASDLVRWVEVDEKRGTVLKYAPLTVAPFLARNLWNDPFADLPGSQEHQEDRYDDEHPSIPRSSVILSATLALGNDFSYIAGRLGAADYDGFDAGTPFSYPKQAALFVPQSNCDPSSGSHWEGMLAASLDRLVAASGGRALLLFTSRRSMDRAFEATAPRMRDAGITVLKQGDAPNRKLAAEFKSNETSVLFALKSFMTGVDVQGDALRLVVIDKLPFPVPTDVIVKARTDALDAEVARTGKNKWTHGSFNAMTVPAMSLILMQAFGRLIRNKSDEGLVCILDDRIYSKKYGKKIMAALPPARRLNTLAEATAYLDELTTRRG